MPPVGAARAPPARADHAPRSRSGVRRRGRCESRPADCAAPTTSSTPGTCPPGSRSSPATRPSVVIESIGPQAAERFGVQVGDRVAVEVFQSCRACDRCDAGSYRHCRQHGIERHVRLRSRRQVARVCGAATRPTSTCRPTRMVLPVPESLDPVLATLFNPIGAGIRWGVTVPGTQRGRRRWWSWAPASEASPPPRPSARPGPGS